jgi:hypothetical protein
MIDYPKEVSVHLEKQPKDYVGGIRITITYPDTEEYKSEVDYIVRVVLNENIGWVML